MGSMEIPPKYASQLSTLKNQTKTKPKQHKKLSAMLS